MTSRSSVWDFLVYSLSFSYCWQHKFKLRLCDNRPVGIISQGILSHPHLKQTRTGFLDSCTTEQVPPFLTLLLQIQCSALRASALSRGSSVTDLCRPKGQDFCFYGCQNPSSLVPKVGIICIASQLEVATTLVHILVLVPSFVNPYSLNDF